MAFAAKILAAIWQSQTSHNSTRKEAFANAKAMIIKMIKTLEKLWNEYLSNECAVIDTEEERKLAKKAVELHEKANALLEKEQEEAVEKYVETLYDIEAVFIKKAFFNGCKFAISFLLETGNLEK